MIALLVDRKGFVCPHSQYLPGPPPPTIQYAVHENNYWYKDKVNVPVVHTMQFRLKRQIDHTRDLWEYEEDI
jgi:hypothetical protein